MSRSIPSRKLFVAMAGNMGAGKTTFVDLHTQLILPAGLSSDPPKGEQSSLGAPHPKTQSVGNSPSAHFRLRLVNSTDAKSRYQIEAQAAYAGPVLLVATGGSYEDAATGMVLPLTGELLARVGPRPKPRPNDGGERVRSPAGTCVRLRSLSDSPLFFPSLRGKGKGASAATVREFTEPSLFL